MTSDDEINRRHDVLLAAITALTGIAVVLGIVIAILVIVVIVLLKQRGKSKVKYMFVSC